MAVLCIISKPKRDVDENHDFVIPSLGGGSVLSEHRHNVWYTETRMMKLPDHSFIFVYKRLTYATDGEKYLIEDTFIRFDTILACDRQTDRQMDRQTDRQTSYNSIVCTYAEHHALKAVFVVGCGCCSFYHHYY